MINRLIELSLRNRLIVVALSLTLGAWGWWAMRVTPIDAIPDLSDNQVIVFTDWPGHSPQEVEDQVTYPLTVNLQGLAGVRVVRSQSAFGFSMIYVIFEDDIDVYFARSRVLERMKAAARYGPCNLCKPPVPATTPATNAVSVAPPPAAPAARSTRCQATTKKGAQCSRNAKAGSSYCWQHRGRSR